MYSIVCYVFSCTLVSGLFLSHMSLCLVVLGFLDISRVSSAIARCFVYNRKYTHFSLMPCVIFKSNGTSQMVDLGSKYQFGQSSAFPRHFNMWNNVCSDASAMCYDRLILKNCMVI
jgi:hypothetical protein